MGLGPPTLAEVTPTHACPMPGPQAAPVTTSSQQARKAQRSEAPPGTDSGTEGGCEFGSAGSPAPEFYFCAHLSSPPHNLKVVPSIPPYRH